MAPPPTTTSNRPFGKNSDAISRIIKSGPGETVAGFWTIALPYKSAGTALRNGVLKGKFHGLIPNTTPRGRRNV